ncbi:MAG: glycoside hydrolase family 88 protein [Lachnospiraceae bacterium]|nr:glycoside hydrolase family 88 protein [Lachnospiraceae bacterium]
MTENYKEFASRIKEKIILKERAVSDRTLDKIPYTAVNGRFDDKSDDKNINWWTNGFYGGMLWLMYRETGDERYAERAERIADKLSVCFDRFYNLDHDMGFLWLPTDVASYRLTGNNDGRRRGLLAANILAGRFNPAGNYIRAWNDGIGKENGPTSNVGWCIIDCLMNLPLLYFASEETKDPRFKHIAVRHADMAIKNFLRADGSVNHIVEINPETGEFVQSFGGQGYGLGSSWTRGQSWALYGFLLSYLHTGEERYLEASKKVADYFVSQIPESGLIPVDFRQPMEPAYEDSTAAAISSCGLIELSKAVSDPKLKDKYMDAALKMLKALSDKRCDFDPETDNLLTHCSASYHAKEHHFPIIYGDYFFMEAIFNLTGSDFSIWK